jgi:hypothetical protein
LKSRAAGRRYRRQAELYFTTDLLKPGLDASQVKDVFAGELQDLVGPLVLGLAHRTFQLVFCEGVDGAL